jgi:hypothetical protein
LEARRDAFNEVAKPLEPYIAVFVVFAAPALVMSTSFCQIHSGASAATGGSAAGNAGNLADFTYGTCDVWCEFALSFRSLATVVVYLVPRERRVELSAVCVTFRKLCNRVVLCIRCAPAPYARLDNDGIGDEHEMSALVEQHQSGDGENDGDVDANAHDDLWRIDERDIALLGRLGHGAFGEVWEGLLQPDNHRVAVKILLAGAMDEDGDPIDANADDDFHKECAALQRVDDSPHLLKFYGFGTTKDGKGFIVTELMLGGSLEDVLHDPGRDIAWDSRARVALQVALGMDHLHKRHMLHRDLKSANVLLDEDFKAKVCDFGLSRMAKPVRRRIVHSPFTGMTRLLPATLFSADVGCGLPSLDMINVGVSVEDAHGNMTKAAGTQLWMAPEVFRGDDSYTPAVDVYSFGIVLWELATRKLPWVDELPSEPAAFFTSFNLALQRGRRPTVPNNVAAEHGAFVAVMRRCWAGDPADRPTFADASRDLAECVRSECAV